MITNETKDVKYEDTPEGGLEAAILDAMLPGSIYFDESGQAIEVTEENRIELFRRGTALTLAEAEAELKHGDEMLALARAGGPYLSEMGCNECGLYDGTFYIY